MPVSANSAGADAGPGQGISYCTAQAFLCESWDLFGVDDTRLNGNLVPPVGGNSQPIIGLPPSYGPRITKVGDGSRKIFASDGARAVIPSASGGINVERPPEYLISSDISRTNWDNTSYADWGAFGGWTHSAYRTAVPGNATHPAAIDTRIWAYRHGTLGAFKAAGQYRMNAVFFDGHGETLDDLASSNPALWLPRGSSIQPLLGCSGSAVAGTKTVWSDAVTTYCPGLTSTSSVWVSP